MPNLRKEDLHQTFGQGVSPFRNTTRQFGSHPAEFLLSICRHIVGTVHVLTRVCGTWIQPVRSLRSSLFASSLYLIAGNVVNAAFGFLFWAGAARLYDPREVGLAAAAFSAIGLLGMVSTLGLDYAMIRYLPHAEDPQGIINSSLTIGTSAALVLSLVFVEGLGVWSPVLRPSQTNLAFVAALVIGTVLTTLMGLLGSVFLTRKRADLILAQSSIFGATKVVCAVVLAAVGRPIGLIGAWVLGLGAAVGCGLAAFLPGVENRRHQLRPAVSRAVVNEMAHFAFANYISTVLWSAPTFLLPLLVANIAGSEANAYFYVAFSISGLLSVIPTAVSLSLFAHGSHDESELVRLTLASLRFSLVLLVVAVGLVFMVGGKLLLIFGKAYSVQATRLLWVLALSAIPIAVNSLYFSVRRVQNRMDQVLICMGLILGITLALGVVLLPRVGLIGAGIAWLVAQCTAAILIAVLYLFQS